MNTHNVHVSRPNPPPLTFFFPFNINILKRKKKQQQQGFEVVDWQVCAPLLLSLPSKSPLFCWLLPSILRDPARVTMALRCQKQKQLKSQNGMLPSHQWTPQTHNRVGLCSSYRPSTSTSPTKGTTGSPVRPQGAALNRHTVLWFGLEMYKQAWYSKCKCYGVSKILRKTKVMCVCIGVLSDGRWVSGLVSINKYGLVVYTVQRDGGCT